MPNLRSITQRVTTLEQAKAEPDGAAELAWGRKVTDAELNAVAAGAVNALLDRYIAGRARVADINRMNDVSLFRLIKPAIEALRGGGVEHAHS